MPPLLVVDPPPTLLNNVQAQTAIRTRPTPSPFFFQYHSLVIRFSLRHLTAA